MKCGMPTGGRHLEEQIMPKLNREEVPVTLKPYRFHGVGVDWRSGDRQASGDCPFCGGEGKFTVQVDTGKWHCHVCNAGQNPKLERIEPGSPAQTFLRLLHRHGTEAPADLDSLAELADDRGLLDYETLAAWGVHKSIVTGDWLVPGWNAEGKLCQLYRYANVDPKRPDKRLLLATAEVGHGLFGMNLWDKDKLDVMVCEGPWDAMALREMMIAVKTLGDGTNGELVRTSNESVSLYAAANVVAVPGCGTFDDSWLKVFAGKRVFLMYDSDHPKKHPTMGLPVPPAGFAGMQRVANLLGGATELPQEVHYLHWGKDGYSPLRPSGFDVRDMLRQGTDVDGRAKHLSKLLSMLRPVPPEWVAGRSKSSGPGGVTMDTLPCSEWRKVNDAWKRAFKWTPGLDRALACMLACCASVKLVGDQLWMKVMSPPSSGKSSLCEAISVARKYVLPKDTLTGVFSGYQLDREAKDDFSLAAKAKDKCLVIKDGDTLLKAPNKEQILSQLRAMYDRAVRTSYGNQSSRNYEELSCSVLLCGTGSLRALDTSELGERFLDVVIMEAIDHDLENDILKKKARQNFAAFRKEVNCSVLSQDSPDNIKARRLTGGYVEWLRQNVVDRLDVLDTPESAEERIANYALFVSYLRARPSARQAESAEREMSTRLLSQMQKLAMCLAVVLNKDTLDEEVLARVRQVALDTARGRTLEMCRRLREAGREAGIEVGILAMLTNEPDGKLRELLAFLRKIGAVERFAWKQSEGDKGRPRWRLSERMDGLWTEVMTEPAKAEST